MKLTIKELEKLKEEASVDKADLFDFYHTHWEDLIAQILKMQDALEDMILELESRTGDKYRPLIEAQAALLPKE